MKMRWLKLRLASIIKSKNNGFTLVETMMALVVTVMVLNIFTHSLMTLRTVNRLHHRINAVAFAQVQFERYLTQRDTLERYTCPEDADTQHAVFFRKYYDNQDHVKQQKFKLELVKRTLRMTTLSDGGYMPLLLGVSKARFKTTKQYILITLTETDGRTSELFFSFPERKEP